MSDPIPSSAIYDATAGGVSVLLVTGGSTGQVLVRQSDGTYLPGGDITVDVITGPGDPESLYINNQGDGGTFLQFNAGNRAWVGNYGVGFYLSAYPMNDNLYDVGLSSRYWRTLFTNTIVMASGTLKVTPVAGYIEFDGTNLYFTKSDGTRKQIAVV